MGLYDYSIYSIIKRNAQIYRDRPAFICNGTSLTHLQFKEKADQLAKGLQGIGFGKGDRIGIIAQNSLEFMYLYGAAAKIGAVMLPVNWRLKPEEIEYVLKDCTPKIVFADSDFQELIALLAAKFDFIEKIYAMGSAVDDFIAFNELMADAESADPAADVEPDVQADDAYVIIHTAAVAGNPRGATLSHQNLVVANLQSIYIWQLDEKDCNLCMLPLFHVAGLGLALNVMHAGGLNVILPKFDPEAALKHIQEDKVSIFFEFPPMLSTLLEKNQELKYDISSVQTLGGMEHPDTIKQYEKITGGTFWTAFGQSETAGFVTFAPFNEKPGSAGKPSPLAEVEIVDPHDDFLPPGKPGEIVVRGPLVFKGYWNLPEDNEHTFRNGWHHTGDMGRFDEDGYLFYVARMPEKELIKPGGENVYPAEVEKIILEHPMVEETSVIGIRDKKWGEAIKAVCKLKESASLIEADLIEFVASKIARFKKPKEVVFVDQLPKTEDGEIDRLKVKADYGDK